MLYEIGDPKAYILPDVICDFSKVKLTEKDNGVFIEGALGHPPTDSLKVCATYMDGFKITCVTCIGGHRTREKSLKTAQAILKRCRIIFKKMGLDDFTRTHIQLLGCEDTYGAQASISNEGPRDAAMWMSVQHNNIKALQIFSMEIASAGTGMAPGLTAIVGGRPKPTPLLRLHSFLINKKDVQVSTKLNNESYETCLQDNSHCISAASLTSTENPVSKIPQLIRGEFT